MPTVYMVVACGTGFKWSALIFLPQSTTFLAGMPLTQIDEPLRERNKNGWTFAVCMTLLLVCGTVSYTAVLTKCATYDETEHSISGYVVRTFNDYRIDPQDPALFAWISSIPHKSGALQFDAKSADFQQVMKVHDMEWIVALKTLYRTPENNPDAYINGSRLVFTLILMAAGAMVCWWAWTLAGRISAVAATAAYAFDPNFLGHGSLVKNDVPLALITVGLLFAIWRFGKRGTIANMLAIVIALSCAMTMKFSGPLFFVITFVVLLARSLMPETWNVIGLKLTSRLTRLLVPVAVCAVGVVVAYVFIWACYGFRYSPTPDSQLHFDFDAIVLRAKQGIWIAHNQSRDMTKLSNEQALAEIGRVPEPFTVSVIRSLMDHCVLPEAWLYGFFYTYATTIMRGSFLNGQYSSTGWWYFFPLCLLYKTPVSMLAAAAIGLVAGAVLAAQKRAKLMLPSVVWAAACLGIPVAIYGGVAMSNHFNLGIRHILPLMPFLHIGIGLVVARILWRWGTTGILLAAGLGMALVVESCSVWPNYISFFNVALGGARNGLFLLSDSNLDWGQDLKLLAEWHRQHPEKQIFLCYFGMADPEYYGISNIGLPGGYLFPDRRGQLDPNVPGIVAISATNLQGTYMNMDPMVMNYYAPFRKVEAREILGDTIYLFDWPIRQSPLHQ